MHSGPFGSGHRFKFRPSCRPFCLPHAFRPRTIRSSDVMEINSQAPLVARKEILIQAPLEAVWDIQTNISAWKDWQPDISKSQLIGDLATKSVFKWTSGGFAVTSTLEEVVPQQRIAWTGKAFGSRARHLWIFMPEKSGTLVRTEESMEGWLISLLKLLMPGFLDKSLDVWLKNLKMRAEGTRTP
jgi:uncharacterized protein YndB with AHSA1/START domain